MVNTLPINESVGHSVMINKELTYTLDTLYKLVKIPPIRTSFKYIRQQEEMQKEASAIKSKCSNAHGHSSILINKGLLALILSLLSFWLKDSVNTFVQTKLVRKWQIFFFQAAIYSINLTPFSRAGCDTRSIFLSRILLGWI